jgi:putative sigma-54 modulation protein
MQINLQTPHINIAGKTREMVLTKLARLEKIYDRIEQCHVVLKLAVPGNDLFAKERSENWSTTMDKVMADLTNALKKKKEKLNSRGTRAEDRVVTSIDWETEDDDLT